MKKQNFLTAILLAFGLFFTACSSDDDNPAPVNEEETITTVRLTFTDTADNSESIFAYRNVDGTTTVNDIQIVKDHVYNVSIAFLDETDANDVENITEEVIEEADEHFVTYSNPSSLGLNIQRPLGTDVQNTDGKKIGINTIWQATNAGQGNMEVKLTHQPGSVDDSDGFGSVSGGSADAEVTFTVNVTE